MNPTRIAACCLALVSSVCLAQLQELPAQLADLGKQADAGDARAMLEISRAWGNGSLGKRDLFQSCVWVLRADRNAGADAQLKHSLAGIADYCRQSLPLDQLGRASKLAESYPPKAAAKP
jgi:hypothetical protein